MRIMLAIDGSRFSEAAVQNVIARARPQDTEVRVLHVVDPPSFLGAQRMGLYDRALDGVLEEETKEAEALVTKVADELRSKGLKVTTEVEQGDPRSKIIDAASKWHADVIVVGSHGHRGLVSFLLGSVSEGVARHAGCSVEIVRISSRTPAPRY